MQSGAISRNVSRSCFYDFPSTTRRRKKDGLCVCEACLMCDCPPSSPPLGSQSSHFTRSFFGLSAFLLLLGPLLLPLLRRRRRRRCPLLLLRRRRWQSSYFPCARAPVRACVCVCVHMNVGRARDSFRHRRRSVQGSLPPLPRLLAPLLGYNPRSLSLSLCVCVCLRALQEASSLGFFALALAFTV